MAKRSSIRITKTVVDSLGPGQVVWDAEVKGFGIRCQAKGKSYTLKTAVQGRTRWLTIGLHGSPWTPDSARAEAKRLLGETVQGKDPTEAKFRERVRMKELCARYLEQYAIPKKKASSVRLDRMNIDNHVLPLLGQKFVDELKPADIETFKNAVRNGKTAPKDAKEKQKEQGGGLVVKGGPGVSNRCLTLLSKIFNLAELWGLRPKASNPVKGIARYGETPKERFLSEEEFQKLGAVLNQFERDEAESIYAVAAIRLLIHTGARLSEILTLRWDHVQFDRRRLRLINSKTGPKNIELTEPAIELLQNLPRIDGNPFVIAGRRRGQHLVDLQRPWQRIRNAAGLSDVRIHDLRHSFASMAIRNGISINVIGKLLGHRSSETTRRYAHLEDSYIAQENDKVGALLAAAMAGKKCVSAEPQ
ncbi:Site-specific recombinase XerD OS=Bosea thiooxidans OX=53254 GN=SAMN05660750_03866 PE=4 SV=1 [Bosea thiooxidans]